MTCGTCLHSRELTQYWPDRFRADHVHCSYGPGGDHKHIGALLLRKDQACRWEPTRFEREVSIWSGG